MPSVAELDETGAAPMASDIAGIVDVPEMDRQQRRETHPFALYCDEVREAEGIAPSQAAREVTSSVCNAVARLTIIEEDTLDEQAEHIAKLVAKEREEMGDRQLWTVAAGKLAKRALRLRLDGKAVVADAAAA
jgi:hypothetical protein